MPSEGRGPRFKSSRVRQFSGNGRIIQPDNAIALRRETAYNPHACRPGLTVATSGRASPQPRIGGAVMAARFSITIARFWSKVDVGEPTQCWLWRGGTGASGHGRFKADGKLVSPHRFAWTLAYGPIPEGEGYHGTVIRHGCDNPRCCNPYHLRAGTQLDNVRDMDTKGRRIVHGSRFTDEQLRAIAADPRPNRVVAAEYGTVKSYVQRIKARAAQGVPV